MLNKKKIYWSSQVIGWLLYAVIVGAFNMLTGNQLNTEFNQNIFFQKKFFCRWSRGYVKRKRVPLIW